MDGLRGGGGEEESWLRFGDLRVGGRVSAGLFRMCVLVRGQDFIPDR